jgi:hypothetical protein
MDETSPPQWENTKIEPITNPVKDKIIKAFLIISGLLEI